MKRAACLMLAALLAISPVCASAQEVVLYPIALVNVKEGSSLKVRREPAGKWAYFNLPCRMDVVILQTVDGWALVTTPERMRTRDMPIGWVSADYLLTYCAYIDVED